jgi:hypothetical protein
MYYINTHPIYKNTSFTYYFDLLKTQSSYPLSSAFCFAWYWLSVPVEKTLNFSLKEMNIRGTFVL